MASKSTARTPSPRPATLAERYEKRQRTQALQRLLPVLVTLLVVVLPILWRVIPDTIGPVPVRQPFHAVERLLATTIPKGSPVAIPLGRLIVIGVCGYWIIAILTLISTWSLLRRQQRLSAEVDPATYYRVRVPRTLKVKEQDKGTDLLTNIAYRLAPPNRRRPAPCPVVLRWTGLPKQAIQQGVALAGDRPFLDGMRQFLKTIGVGVEVFAHADPLLTAVETSRTSQQAEGRESLWLLWCDLRLSLDSAFPLRVEKQSLFLPPLIEAMLPAASILATDVQIMLAGTSQRGSKQKTRYLRTSMKEDLERGEVQLLTQKASSPSLDGALRLVVLTDDRAAGQSTLMTMTTALTSVRQAFGMQEQALVAGPIQTYDLHQPAPGPVTRPWDRLWRAACGLGAVGSIAHAVLRHAWTWPLVYWWLVPVLLLALMPLPRLIRERRLGYPAYWQMQAACKSIPRPSLSA